MHRMLGQVVELLGQDMVIYRHDNGVGTVKSKVIGVHNPGTPESALIDMRLLSECSELVITVASSYGSVAAAWGGIAPVQMLHGLHANVQVSTAANHQAVPEKKCRHLQRLFRATFEGKIVS